MIRDALAADFDGRTLPTDDLDVRVYPGVGVLVAVFAVFAVLDGPAVEEFWLRIDRQRPAQG